MYTNKQIWSVSYPILLSLLAQNVINVTDTAFLGHVSEVALGASAMGGLFYICVFTIAFGFSTGSQIVIARRNGEGRYSDVGPVMIQGVMFLFVMALLLFGFTKAFGGNIMRLLVSSESIYEGTMEFLDWRIYGFFFSFINVMFRALYIGITRTKVLTINAIVMALTNVVLDYALIFGKFGLPEMGIKGAAIASVLAEASSILFFVIYTYATVDLKKYGMNRLRTFDPALLMRILSISCFTMLQYFLSMATWFVFFVAVERLGQRELAIANIVRSIYVVLLIPVNALATTTNSLVSNAIGAGGIQHVMPLINKIARFLRIDPVEQARRIREAEQNDPLLRGRVIHGIADPAIFDESRGESIAAMMERSPNFLRWSPGDNTRLAGKMQFHYRLNFDADGRPMFQVFNTCKHFIRTIPNLVYDESNVEDIDTRQEDHIYDECRYVLMENPISPPVRCAAPPMPDDPLNLHKRARFYRI